MVDPANPPSVVQSIDGQGPAFALDWNQATDDVGQLRRCPVCGHAELYARRTMPQMTWFAAVVALGIVVLLFTYGGHLSPPMLGLLLLLLVVDLVIWRWAPRMLACYRCDAWFSQTPIPRNIGPWDATRALASETKS